MFYQCRRPEFSIGRMTHWRQQTNINVNHFPSELAAPDCTENYLTASWKCSIKERCRNDVNASQCDHAAVSIQNSQLGWQMKIIIVVVYPLLKRISDKNGFSWLFMLAEALIPVNFPHCNSHGAACFLHF